jgi:hypothetical protein
MLLIFACRQEISIFILSLVYSTPEFDFRLSFKLESICINNKEKYTTHLRAFHLVRAFPSCQYFTIQKENRILLHGNTSQLFFSFSLTTHTITQEIFKTRHCTLTQILYKIQLVQQKKATT